MKRHDELPPRTNIHNWIISWKGRMRPCAADHGVTGEMWLDICSRSLSHASLLPLSNREQRPLSSYTHLHSGPAHGGFSPWSLGNTFHHGLLFTISEMRRAHEHQDPGCDRYGYAYDVHEFRLGTTGPLADDPTEPKPQGTE